MQVRMRVEVAGTRNGQPWPKRGGVIELPDQEAAHYCKVGLAEPVPDDRVGTATPPPPEKRRKRNGE